MNTELLFRTKYNKRYCLVIIDDKNKVIGYGRSGWAILKPDGLLEFECAALPEVGDTIDFGNMIANMVRGEE